MEKYLFKGTSKAIVESLHCMPKTNIILGVNYTWIENLKKSNKINKE